MYYEGLTKLVETADYCKQDLHDGLEELSGYWVKYFLTTVTATNESSHLR